MSATGAAPTPPRLPRALLRRAVPEEARDAVDGDLHELYIARRTASGAGAAASWYWLESLSFVMRYMLERLTRALRGLVGGNATPSALDLKLGARMLAKSPGLALVGGFGMAVAVALGAGAYAMVNSYFFPELPLQEGDRVVAIGKFDTKRQREDEQLLHDFLAWKRELRSVVDLGAFRTIQRNLVSETGQAEPIKLAEMTASGFRLARVPSLRGRALLEEDERPGAPAVVVIGYDVWQSRFAGDPAVLGRELRIGRTVHTIVGIMPKGFGFPVDHQYWVPLRIDPRAPVAPGAGPDLDVFGRIAPGQTKESAQAELTVVSRRLAAEGPKELAHLESRIVPYTDIVVHAEAEGESRTWAVMRFMIALLLVVVATNVAVLVYARTVTRTGEIAVRSALGATRGRIVAQLFAEALVLAGLAALVGLGIDAIGLGILDRMIDEASNGNGPFWLNPGLSFGTVVYGLALSVLAAVIVGVLPALRATGAQLRDAMGSLGSGAKARLGRTWTVLIVAQVAIAVAALPPALLKGGQMIQMALLDPGFAKGEYAVTHFAVERDEDATAMAAPNDTAFADSARAIVTAFVGRLATEPGVVGLTVGNSEPWGGGRSGIEVEGADRPAQAVRIVTVDTSYFGLFGARVLAGRNFSTADAALGDAERPVMVNRSFVTELLGGGDAVGRRVRYRAYGDETTPWHTIAGVVEDFPAGVKNPGETSARMYHVTVPGEWVDGMLTVRLRGQSPETFTSTFRRLAASVDPRLQLKGTTSLDAEYREYARTGALAALAIALITGSVLLLSAAGIHALMSFTVTQRRREIGIRSALGAPARLVLSSVLARAMRQLALGVGLGLTAAVAADLASGGALMEGTAVLLVPGTAVFMLVVGLLAAAGPARRGLRVHPTEALRAE